MQKINFNGGDQNFMSIWGSQGYTFAQIKLALTNNQLLSTMLLSPHFLLPLLDMLGHLALSLLPLLLSYGLLVSLFQLQALWVCEVRWDRGTNYPVLLPMSKSS